MEIKPTRTRIITAAVYAGLFLIGIAFIAYAEITQPPHESATLTIVAIIIKGQAAAIVAGGFAVAIEAGGYIVIIASVILDREREKAARQAARKAAREATIKATRKERKRFNEQNKAYYERMRAALDAGEDFNEPPPQFDTDDD